MKRFLGTILATLLITAPGSPVQADDKDPKALLDKAIRSHGGEAALARSLNVVRKASGVMHVGDTQIPFTTEVTLSLPDKMRLAIEKFM